MSIDDKRIRRLTDWIQAFPGAQQQSAPLFKMRTGPLKDFVDKHLVPSLKSETWIKTMEAHFLLDELRKQSESKLKTLGNEREKLRLLKETHSKLKLQEEKLEQDVADELFVFVSMRNRKPSWGIVEDKVSMLQEEARLQSTSFLISGCEFLRKRIEDLYLFGSDNKNSETISNSVQGTLSEKLSQTKNSLSLSLRMSVCVDLRPKSLQLARNAAESLSKVSANDSCEIECWCNSDLEGDKRSFLQEVYEMKEDEKFSLNQKLVHDWTSVHVRLFSENCDLQESVLVAKEEHHQCKRRFPTELEDLLQTLLSQKKNEAVIRCLYNIPKFLTSEGMEAMSDEIELLNNSPMSAESEEEFNFTLACSLLKTWSHAKVVYEKDVEDGTVSMTHWYEACNNIMKATTD